MNIFQTEASIMNKALWETINKDMYSKKEVIELLNELARNYLFKALYSSESLNNFLKEKGLIEDKKEEINECIGMQCTCGNAEISKSGNVYTCLNCYSIVLDRTKTLDCLKINGETYIKK